MRRRSFLAAAVAAGAGAAVGGRLAGQSAPAAHAARARQAQSGGAMFGWVLASERFTGPQLVQYAVAAEQAGFDAVWTSDHFQPWQDNQGHASQAWVNLAAIGASTSRIMFGTGVTCPTYRYRPQIVAEAFATLQNHFPGRVFLGTGTGEALNEIPGGGGWGTYRERADRWVEAVQLIRQLWTGQPVTFQGQYYSENGGRLYDPPSQTIPLYMAASGPESGALAGQYGDGLITDPKMAQDPTMRAAWSNGAATGGQNVAQLQLLTEQYVVVGSEADAQVGAELWRFQPKAWHPYVLDPDPVDIHRRADAEVPLQQVYQDWPVSTDPNVHAQALQKLIAAGVTQIFVHSPLDDQLNAIQFYGQQVLPLLRGGMATS